MTAPSDVVVCEDIDDLYLPFSADELRVHFAPLNKGGDADRHLTYYRKSAEAAAAFALAEPLGTPAERWRALQRGRQMEKDERFWVVTTLLKMFYAPDRVAVLASMLARCLGVVPPIDGLVNWEQALGHEQQLYFEVSLPSPPSYGQWLKNYLPERVIVPYLSEMAAGRAARLEGATRVDALLLAPETGFAVLFEAKVLSDLSTGIRFDVLRNQLARITDVMLDSNPGLPEPLSKRLPDRTCVVLITPDVFRQHPKSRLYGWLLERYRSEPSLMMEHLPHRVDVDFTSVATRLGWLTWEDCNIALPGACPWLPGPDESLKS